MNSQPLAVVSVARGSRGDDISIEPLAGLANNLSALALNMLTLSTSGRVA